MLHETANIKQIELDLLGFSLEGGGGTGREIHSQILTPTPSSPTTAVTEASAKLNPELWIELSNLGLMQVFPVKKC